MIRAARTCTMRAPRFAPILALFALPTLGSGCGGVATESRWPAGTEAVIATRNPDVLAYVPLTEQENVGSREWVSIPNGTRVICVDGLHDVYSAPGSSTTDFRADFVRVKPFTGEYQGIELVVLRGELIVSPPPEPNDSGALVLLLVVWVCAAIALACVETCVDRAIRWYRSVRHWRGNYPRGWFARRHRADRIGLAAPHRAEADDARWLAWIASRNALVRGSSGIFQPGFVRGFLGSHAYIKSSSWNRERLAWGAGGGNEHPCSTARCRRNSSPGWPPHATSSNNVSSLARAARAQSCQRGIRIVRPPAYTSAGTSGSPPSSGTKAQCGRTVL